jgi:hypothetical protein
MKLAHSLDEGVEGLHVVFGMHRQRALSLLENINQQITQEHLKEAVEFLSEISEIDIEVSFVEKLLALYPAARINIALVDGVHGDSEARDELSFAFSHFILGCPWPMCGDQIDMVEFIALLQRQYTLLLKEI